MKGSDNSAFISSSRSSWLQIAPAAAFLSTALAHLRRAASGRGGGGPTAACGEAAAPGSAEEPEPRGRAGAQRPSAGAAMEVASAGDRLGPPCSLRGHVCAGVWPLGGLGPASASSACPAPREPHGAAPRQLRTFPFPAWKGRPAPCALPARSVPAATPPRAVGRCGSRVPSVGPCRADVPSVSLSTMDFANYRSLCFQDKPHVTLSRSHKRLQRASFCLGKFQLDRNQRPQPRQARPGPQFIWGADGVAVCLGRPFSGTGLHGVAAEWGTRLSPCSLHGLSKSEPAWASVSPLSREGQASF